MSFRSVLIILCGLATFDTTSAGRASAQNAPQLDRLWYQPEPATSSDSGLLPRPIALVVGKVLDANQKVFKVEPNPIAEPVFLDADRLVWLEPAWANDQAVLGIALFNKGDYAAAVESLYAGITAKPPVWQQQWLLAHLALAAYEMERFSSVMQLSEDFCNSKPPSSFLGMLPIHWSSRNMPPPAIAEARDRITSQQPFVRLIAASWLLSSPDDRALAERILDSLAVDRSDRVLSVYATVLRWRRTPVPTISAQADAWIEGVEKLPIMLQPGPLLTIADRLQAAGEAAKANELFRAVSLLHRQPKPLADRAKAELIVRRPN